MPLINKLSFIDLITNLTAESSKPYVGMGNPDSNILMVGTEKALNADNPNNDHESILIHELCLNVAHWNNLLVEYNYLDNPFDLMLLERPLPFAGFNPFSPLLFEITHNMVYGKGGRTYYGIQRLVNHYEVLHNLPVTNAFETINFNNSTFSKCFITEISANPAINQMQAAFKLNHFFEGDRYNFMTNEAAAFYQSFSTVVIYAGKNKKYVGQEGTENRLNIIRIFNPNLEHFHIHRMENHIYYDNGEVARVILCRHLAGGFGHARAHEIALSIVED